MSDTLQTTITWTLGDKLAKARKVAGLEQADAAKKLDVSRALVSLWEHDKGEPKASQLAVLANLYGQPVDWFLTCCDYWVTSPYGLEHFQTTLFDSPSAEIESAA